MITHDRLQPVRPSPSFISSRRTRPGAHWLSVLFAVALLLGGIGALPAPVEAAAPTHFYVEQTGHSLGGDFLSWWIDNDGRESLGNPVTEPLISREGTRQYFEFGVLLEKDSNDIVREPAGAALRKIEQSPNLVITPLQSSIVVEIESIRTLTTLGGGHFHSVEAEVEKLYDSLGGRSYFGRSLSGLERAGGTTAQWFEYGRIEVSPGGASLAPVGAELAEARDVDMSAASRGDAPIFNPDRYVTFHGDGTIPNADGVFIPSRIVIPSINIDAPIESVGVTNGIMDTPVDEWNVGWYPSMSSPGEWTNVVMSGHKDWWNVGPVVFWDLEQLKAGDRIYVIGPNGAGATYEVTLTWLIDANAPADPLIADTGYEALTLITCAGQWNGSGYTDRQIVRARRI